MSATDAAIGMMDGAYFTSRKEILDFLNNLLDLNLTKIEQTCSGAVACQITEYLFPNSIPMSRVNWGAKSSHEYVANYKLLQNAFTKNKIQRHVDVDKLIRGKYQDNLEFCQWLKAFFDMTWTSGSGARSSVGAAGPSVKRSTVGSTRATKPSSTVAASSSRPASSSSTSSRLSSSSSSRVQKENMQNSSMPTSSTITRKPSASSSSSSSAQYEEQIRKLKSDNSHLQTKYSELEQSSAELEITLQNVESERDFYFEKLRGIETMLQVYQERKDVDADAEGAEKVIGKIFKVMYATMEDNVVVDDEGNLIGDNISLEQPNEESIYLDANAQDDHGDEYDDEDLLTSDLNDPVVNSINEPIEKLSLKVHDDDGGDFDDDELLTSGVEDVAPSPTATAALKEEAFRAVALHDYDDDFGDDDDLLAD